MKWGWLLLGVLLSCGGLGWGEKGLDFPEYDGKDRVHDLHAKNFKSVMRQYDVMVIYYHEHVGASKAAQKQFEMEELALEPEAVSVFQENTLGKMREETVKGLLHLGTRLHFSRCK